MIHVHEGNLSARKCIADDVDRYVYFLISIALRSFARESQDSRVQPRTRTLARSVRLLSFPFSDVNATLRVAERASCHICTSAFAVCKRNYTDDSRDERT